MGGELKPPSFPDPPSAEGEQDRSEPRLIAAGLLRPDTKLPDQVRSAAPPPSPPPAPETSGQQGGKLGTRNLLPLQHWTNRSPQGEQRIPTRPPAIPRGGSQPRVGRCQLGLTGLLLPLLSSGLWSPQLTDPFPAESPGPLPAGRLPGSQPQGAPAPLTPPWLPSEPTNTRLRGGHS